MPWGVAAAAVSVGGGLLEQSNASSATGKASKPLSNAQNDLYTQSEDIAGTPYTPYTGQQTAGLSANQQQAIDQSSQAAGPGGAAAQYIDKAGQQADFIAGNQWNSATASKYMNPYTQNVTNLALNKENQSYANTLNAQNANSTASGAFGGDRAALTGAATTAGHEYNQGALEAQGQAAAYTSAGQMWQNDNQRANTAASDYANAGNDVTNMNQSQIQGLLATGGADQVTQQAGLSANYNNYLDKRNWAQNELAPLESAAGRTPTLAPAMPVNYAGALMGAGSAIAGYAGTNANGNTNVSTGTQLSDQNTSDLDADGSFGSFDTNDNFGAGSNINVPASSTPQTIDGTAPLVS